MQQITINDIVFTLFNDGTIGIEVTGPMDIIDVDMLEYICDLENSFMGEKGNEQGQV